MSYAVEVEDQKDTAFNLELTCQFMRKSKDRFLQTRLFCFTLVTNFATYRQPKGLYIISVYIGLFLLLYYVTNSIFFVNQVIVHGD
jgi:hypothetical protein